MEMNKHARIKSQTRLSGPHQISNQGPRSPCNILISLSTEMPRSSATLRDLAAALQQTEEKYLEKFSSVAAVARVAVWDGNTTAGGVFLQDGTIKFTVQDVICRSHLLHRLKAANIAYVQHISAQLSLRE